MSGRGSLGWPTWVGVVVEDLDAQRRFWGQLLGEPDSDAGPDYVQFDMDDGRSFELIERSSEPEYDRVRFQVGFEVDDIHSVRDELIKRGVEPITEIVLKVRDWITENRPLIETMFRVAEAVTMVGTAIGFAGSERTPFKHRSHEQILSASPQRDDVLAAGCKFVSGLTHCPRVALVETCAIRFRYRQPV